MSVDAEPLSAAEAEVRPAGEGGSAPTEALTLERSLAMALARNPQLAAAAYDVTASGTRIDQARAGRWPILRLESSFDHFLDEQRLVPARLNGEPGIFDKNILRGDLVVSLPLYTSGRLASEIRAAELLHQAQKNGLARTREELVFNVSSIFYAILGQRRVIDSLEFSTKAMEEHLQRVSDLLSMQKAARVDLLRTQVRLADLRQQLVSELNVLAVEKRVLANLLGLEEDIEQLAIEGELAFAEVPVEAGELYAGALASRSDYLAAEAELAAQGRRVDIARAEYRPTVSLRGSYGLRATPEWDQEEVGSLGVNLSLPLWEGGQRAARVGEEQARLAAVRERLRGRRLQIRQEIETAALNVRASTARTEATRKAIDEAKEGLRIERLKYELGEGSITDVFDAQAALLQTETSYYRALADFRTALAQLDLAAGVHREPMKSEK